MRGECLPSKDRIEISVGLAGGRKLCNEKSPYWGCAVEYSLDAACKRLDQALRLRFYSVCWIIVDYQILVPGRVWNSYSYSLFAVRVPRFPGITATASMNEVHVIVESPRP